MMKGNISAAGKWISVLLFTGSFLFSAAQDQNLHTIENRLEAHRNKSLQEKLFVHTDKKAYLAGELLWFKLYYVEGFTHHPLQLSRLAYLELLNTNNQAVMQAKVSLKKGEDNGSLQLPLNLPTGAYKLRAYTKWMKNFSPDYYFEKEINIINTLSGAKEKSQASAAPAHEINFFPEGGYLVKDLPSVLAFKANDAYGRSVDFKGWILNEKNDTITSFSPLRFGMGSIPFTPAGNHSYRAVVFFADGKQVRKELPNVQENGYVMNLQAATPNQLKIEVRTSRNNSPTVFLLAHTREVIRVAEQASFKNGIALFNVDATKLEPGVTHFTIFDANRSPIAERLYFKRPIDQWKAEIQTDKKEYASREKINLTLRTIDSDADRASASLSLSVFRVDSIQVPEDINIENYLLLTSDLAGKVEAPGFYFGELGAEREQATDNLMLTQGWRRFRWQNILNEKADFSAKYPPEVNGPLVTARVYKNSTGQIVSGRQTFLSLPGKKYQVYFASSDSAGQVQFELKDYFGQGELIVRPFAADDSLYRIELQSPYSEQFTTRPFTPFKLQENAKGLLLNYNVGMQVRQVYGADSLNRFSVPEAADSFSFFGIPDYTYHLDNYTRFTTTEEVLREFVRPINVGTRRGKPHMIFIHETNRTTHDENLLVMLDGVPIYDADRLFAYDPLKVQKLEIFTRPQVLGSSYFFGVANFSTYKGAFDGFELNPHLLALDYQGLQMQREFYAPRYETPAQKASRLPDYRNTLYWNPEVQTTPGGATSLSFFSCDQKGHYLGVLQGIDSKGHPLVREFTFAVR